MTAGWSLYAEGLSHHMPCKSYQRDSHGQKEQEHFEDTAFKEGERNAVRCCLNAKSSHVFAPCS